MSRTYQKLPFFSALHGSGCRHQRLAAAFWPLRWPGTGGFSRDGGRVKRSRRFCYLAKSPTLLTPEEASSLAVESQQSANPEICERGRLKGDFSRPPIEV